MKQRQKVNNMSTQYFYGEYNLEDDEDMDIPLLPIPSAMRNNKYPTTIEDHGITVPKAQKPVMEAEILPGDSLQAISLRFHCPVSEIKRINNIHRENEIFARNTLKIPITLHSMLLGTLPAVHKSGNNSPEKFSVTPVKNPKSVVLNSQELQEKLFQASTSSTSATINCDSSLNDVIFNSTMTPLERTVVNKACDQLLCDTPLIRLPAQNNLIVNGSDWGVKWYHLLIVIVIICFMGPLIYVLYVAEHLDKFQHHNMD